MHSTSYANLDVFEGNVSGSTTISFARRPKRILITNDSASNDLQFKFKEALTSATLKPTETITLDISQPQVILTGNGDYRVWGIG